MDKARSPLFEAVARMCAPSASTLEWHQNVADALARQAAEEAEWLRYVDRRDEGFTHEAIARFFTGRDSDKYQAWYSDLRAEARDLLAQGDGQPITNHGGES